MSKEPHTPQEEGMEKGGGHKGVHRKKLGLASRIATAAALGVGLLAAGDASAAPDAAQCDARAREACAGQGKRGDPACIAGIRARCMGAVATPTPAVKTLTPSGHRGHNPPPTPPKTPEVVGPGTDYAALCIILGLPATITEGDVERACGEPEVKAWVDAAKKSGQHIISLPTLEALGKLAAFFTALFAIAVGAGVFAVRNALKNRNLNRMRVAVEAIVLRQTGAPVDWKMPAPEIADTLSIAMAERYQDMVAEAQAPQPPAPPAPRRG